MLSVINLFSQRARGVWQTVNKAWQSFKKSHKRRLLQNQESCEFMIWLILLMCRCWRTKSLRDTDLGYMDEGCVKSDDPGVWENTGEGEKWMVERDGRHRMEKKNVTNVSHNCGLYIPEKGSYDRLPPANSACTQRNTHSHNLFSPPPSWEVCFLKLHTPYSVTLKAIRIDTEELAPSVTRTFKN